jgi:type IV secretion system protein TrbG
MRHVAVLLLASSLAACTLPQPEPELATPAPLALPETPAPPEPPPAVPEAVWPEPPVVITVPAVLPAHGEAPAPKKARSGERPEQVIREAQQAARVAPTKSGYFGGSGIQQYIWVPGKIYDIYLAPSSGTKLMLPPGEILAHALILNPKSFDVNSAIVGDELHEQSLLLIRPCAASEENCVPSPTEVEVAVTSKSGRSYNLHLIIGKIGMVEVSWQLTPIPRLEVAEPGMLPRRERP